MAVSADAVLHDYVERVEGLAGEIAALNAEIEGIYAEALKAGVDVRAIRQRVRERAKVQRARRLLVD